MKASSFYTIIFEICKHLKCNLIFFRYIQIFRYIILIFIGEKMVLIKLNNQNNCSCFLIFAPQKTKTCFKIMHACHHDFYTALTL
jgi:hypothetical protein